MTTAPQLGPGLTVSQGIGVGVAELLALAQIVATGTSLGFVVFGACNIVIGLLVLARAWRRRSPGFTVLAVLLLLAGGLVSGAAGHSLLAPSNASPAAATTAAAVEPAAAPTTTGPAVAITTHAAGAVGTKSSSPVASADVVFEGQVSLKAGTAVDLEAGQTEGVRAPGPNGDLDLYHDAAYGLTVNGGDLYVDEGPSKDAAARCKDMLEAQENRVSTVSATNVGRQSCFRTGQGHVAWMRVNSETGMTSSHVVVLNVVVWK
jgi:hypothetical protein